MKPSCRFIALTIIVIFSSGCADEKARTEIEAIRNHSFEFTNPKLEIVVLKRDIVPASGTKYSHPTFRVTGIIRQIGTFPLAEYTVNVSLDAKAKTKPAVDLMTSATMKNGNGAFTAERLMYDTDADEVLVPDAFEVMLTNVAWWRMPDWKTWATLKTE